MKGAVEVPLTRGCVAIIDAEDLPLVAKHRWYAVPGGRTMYALTHVRHEGKRKTLMMHRLLAPFAGKVDHIDGDGLNNRRSNLREATVAQNSRNKRIGRNNTSGFKGVFWREAKKRWRAGIEFNGRTIELGLHRTPEEAARAYDRAAIEHFGEFARTNVMLGLLPPEGD